MTEKNGEGASQVGRSEALGEECVRGRQSNLVRDGQEGRQRREPAEAIQVSREGKSSDGR